MFLYVDVSALGHAIAHSMDIQELQNGPAAVALGIASQIAGFVRAHQTRRVYWCLDSKEGSWRRHVYADYKANRAKMYEDDPDRKMRRDIADKAVKETMPELIQLLECPVFSMPWVEADDCCAALVGLNPGQASLILTTDKDYWQLISPTVTILNPIHQYRISLSPQGTILQTKSDGTQEDYGVTPANWVLVKALQGDKSDNLPGLVGCGEETALKVVRENRAEAYLTEQTGMVMPRKSKNNQNPQAVNQDARAVAARNVDLMSLTASRVYEKVQGIMQGLEKAGLRERRTNYTKLVMWLDAHGFKNPEIASSLATTFSTQWTS